MARRASCSPDSRPVEGTCVTLPVQLRGLEAMRLRNPIGAFSVMGLMFVGAVTDADARARSRGPERHGNMKTIVIPDKGEPQTVIAPGGDSNRPAPRARAANRPTSSGISNPAPSSLPVRKMVEPGLR